MSSFECVNCNANFESEDKYELHMKSGHHSADDQVLISSLLALAGEPASLQIEPNFQQPAKVFLCGECSREFLSAEDCSSHVLQEHRNAAEGAAVKVELKCSLKGCPYTFNSKDHLEIHSSCHAESGFKCFFCEASFGRWKKCSMHLWRQHKFDLDLKTCPQCPNLKFAHDHELEVHAQVHSQNYKYICGICLTGFKQISQFRNHSVTHMDKEKESVPNWFAKKQCDICHKIYADSKCLKKHVQAVHSKLKPYICQVCNHQCARKHMLEMHMRQHTGDKPFRCDDCEYRTGDHNSLRRHKMRHTGDKPYK